MVEGGIRASLASHSDAELYHSMYMLPPAAAALMAVTPPSSFDPTRSLYFLAVGYVFACAHGACYGSVDVTQPAVSVKHGVEGKRVNYHTVPTHETSHRTSPGDIEA